MARLAKTTIREPPSEKTYENLALKEVEVLYMHLRKITDLTGELHTSMAEGGESIHLVRMLLNACDAADVSLNKEAMLLLREMDVEAREKEAL